MDRSNDVSSGAVSVEFVGTYCCILSFEALCLLVPYAEHHHVHFPTCLGLRTAVRLGGS
jgi:hypothetical protein